MVSRPTEELVESLATVKPTPAAGPAAALATAAAAGIVAMAGRTSMESWDEARAVVAQAEALQARGRRLADEDAEALAAYLAARHGDLTETRETRDFRLGQALLRAADVPLAIAETACDTAMLAAHTAEHCAGDVRPDAAAAAMLAHGAARAAAHLVEVNLATAPDDERVRHAQGLVRAAAAAAETAAQRADF